ncbi:hypothetical protein PAPYR_6302 [Paratrimastix pyriformis]|uniref:Uncharacterized protein n=1 Tax=Paratrimastix pyriformis TaxID=342808 RepID=A0ABQ8UFL4_9EUKA|nr:hypothetical protein PAPYR_6302 [Paratrimastix pyriformis]
MLVFSLLFARSFVILPSSLALEKRCDKRPHGRFCGPVVSFLTSRWLACPRFLRQIEFEQASRHCSMDQIEAVYEKIDFPGCDITENPDETDKAVTPITIPARFLRDPTEDLAGSRIIFEAQYHLRKVPLVDPLRKRPKDKIPSFLPPHPVPPPPSTPTKAAPSLDFRSPITPPTLSLGMDVDSLLSMVTPTAPRHLQLEEAITVDGDPIATVTSPAIPIPSSTTTTDAATKADLAKLEAARAMTAEEFSVVAQMAGFYRVSDLPRPLDDDPEDLVPPPAADH